MGTALVLLVQARTGRASTAGFVQTAVMLPYVLSGPVIGNALDRISRPRSLAVALAGSYTAAAILLLLAAGRVPLPLALLVAVAVGCTEPVVVALTGLLPRFVPAERLSRAYGLEASSYNLAAIVGPGLAAGLAAWAGTEFAALAVIISAMLGAAVLPLLTFPGPAAAQTPAAPSAKRPETAPAENPDTPLAKDPGAASAEDPDAPPAKDPGAELAKEPEAAPAHDPDAPSAKDPQAPPAKDQDAALAKGPGAGAPAGGLGAAGRSAFDIIVGGLAVLWYNRSLCALTSATTLAWLSMGGIAIAAVLLAEHVGAAASAGGNLLAAFAAGSFAGSLAAARWLQARQAERVMLIGLVAFGAALATLAVSPNLPLAMVSFVAAGLFEGPVFAATLMLRQREAPADRLGQVNTTAGSLKIGAAALGAGLAGLVADHIGARWLILGIAAFQGAGAALGWAILRLSRRPDTP